MGGAPSRAEEVKIVHAGKHIDEYFGPAVSVAEIMLSSSHGGTPEVCRCPSTVWAPEVALMRGNRFFFIVPFYTFFHLVRRQSCNGMSTTSTTPCIVRRSNSGSASSEPRQSADSSFSGEHEKVVASTTTIASLDAPASCHTVLYKSPMRMQIVNETSSKIRPALREHQHRRSSDHKETVVVREKVMQPKSSSKWHQEAFRLNVAMETHNTTHRIPKNSLNRVLHKLSDDERARSSAIDKGRNTESLRERSIEDAGRGSASKTGIEDAAVGGAAASQRRLKLADHLDDERRDVLRGLQERQNTHHGRSDTEEMRRRRCTAAGGMVVPSSCNVEAGAAAKLSPPPAGQRLSALCVARFTRVARCERNAYVVPRNTLKHEERNPSSLAMVMRSDSRIKNSTSSTVTTASGSSRGHPIKIAYNNVFEKGRVADKERDHETSTRVERLKLATRSADWISCTWSCNDATRRSSSQVRRRGLHLSPYLVEEAVKDRKRALQLQLQENGKILDRRKSAEMQANRRTKDDWNTESTAEDVAVENSTWQSKKHEYIVEFEGDDDMRSEVAYNEENLDSRSLPDVHLFQHLHQLYTGSISISDILSSDQLARINEVAKAPGRSSSSSSHKLRHTSDPIVEKHKELDRKRTSILLKMLQTGKAQLGTSEAMKTYNNLKRVSKSREQVAARDSSMMQSKLPSSSSETLSRRPKLAEYFNTSTGIMQTSRDHHYTIARKNNLALSHTCAKSVLESQDNAPSRITSTFTDHNLMGEEFDLPIINNQSFKTSTLTEEDNLSSFEHSLAFPSLFVPDATMLRYRRRSSRRSRRHRGQWQPHLATLNECSP